MSESTSKTTPVESGSVVQNNYVMRQSTVYAVFEHELSNLGAMTDTQSRWSNAGWAALSFACGLAANYAFQAEATPESRILTFVVGPITFVAAMCCFRVAHNASRELTTGINNIKTQSGQKPASTVS